MNKLINLVSATTLLASSSAFAFDDNREGFILGVGAGVHHLDDEYTTEKGIATSFKAGYGFTEQFSLYYVRNASWYSSESYNGDITIAEGIAGLGANYYFSPESESFYAMAAFGIGDISAPFEADLEADTGSATMFGLGYELNKHVQVEATYLSNEIDDSYSTYKSSAFQLTINYLWY